jgi:hypothetical protein
LAVFFGNFVSQRWQLSFLIPSEAKCRSFSLFESFSPAMKFPRGQMLELNFMNSCYSLRVLTAWFGSPFGGVFFICPQLGCLIASSSFLFLRRLSFSFLDSFDACTVEAVRSFSSCVPESALEKGKRDFSRGNDPQEDEDEVDDDIESEVS